MLRKIGGGVVLILSGICITAFIVGFLAKLIMDNPRFSLDVGFVFLILGIFFIYFGSYLWDIKRIKKLVGIVLTISGCLIIFIVKNYIFIIKPGERGYDNRILIIIIQLFIGLLLLAIGIALIIKQKKDDNKLKESINK